VNVRCIGGDPRKEAGYDMMDYAKAEAAWTWGT
jgi:hypothetical protein